MVGGQVSPAGSTHSGGLACSPVTVGGGAGAGRAGDGVGPWRVPGRCTVPGRTRASAAPLPAKAGAGLLKTSRTRPASLFPRAHGTPAAPGPATITMWECMEARVHNRTRAGRHAHAQPVCQRDGGPGGQQVALHQLQRGARPVALARGGVVTAGGPAAGRGLRQQKGRSTTVSHTGGCLARQRAAGVRAAGGPAAAK